MSEAPDRFETIAWVYSQTELAVLLSLLESEDIHVLPVARGHISVDWTLTIALGGVEIRVHPEDAAGARALLAGIDRTPSRRGIFFEDRLLDILLIALLFCIGCLVVPARLPPISCRSRARRSGALCLDAGRSLQFVRRR